LLDEPAHAPGSAAANDERDQAMREGYGIEKIDHLPGNIGYIDLRGFGSTEFAGPAYTSAIALLAGTDALILDLRRNGGGSPLSVAYLLSHFFPRSERRHLNDMYDRRTGKTREFWTETTVAQRYDMPFYVLTSARTFSAGEECAYDFQTQKRATLAGETTGGGANPVSRFSVRHGILAAIPTARPINPVTGTNWKHVGVKPDIAVPAEQALQTAHVAIAQRAVIRKGRRCAHEVAATSGDGGEGDTEKAVYTLRQDR
jgi:C-terminal processing protease CtpA/Prc